MTQDEDGNATEADALEWLFDEAMESLRRYYGPAMDGLLVERLVVGVFVTGVRLSNGCGGVAFTSPEVVSQAGRRILRGSATAIRGMTAAAVALGGDVGPFAPVIRLATLNALSVPVLAERSRGGPADDFAALRPLAVGRRVCMVGAMVPLIERLRECGPTELLVADRKHETLREVEGATVIALDDLPAALATCQTAILTGATIPNGSIAGLLDALSPGAAVAVVGPTAGFVPDPLFSRGVAQIGTTIVTDADRMLDILAEGGGMYHLFDGCLRKITLSNAARLRQLGLDTARAS